jgi:hypothetical protein
MVFELSLIAVKLVLQKEALADLLLLYHAAALSFSI